MFIFYLVCHAKDRHLPTSHPQRYMDTSRMLIPIRSLVHVIVLSLNIKSFNVQVKSFLVHTLSGNICSWGTAARGTGNAPWHNGSHLLAAAAPWCLLPPLIIHSGLSVPSSDIKMPPLPSTSSFLCIPPSPVSITDARCLQRSLERAPHHCPSWKWKCLNDKGVLFPCRRGKTVHPSCNSSHGP